MNVMQKDFRWNKAGVLIDSRLFFFEKTNRLGSFLVYVIS